MTALFARAGVDYGQWKAVSRMLLRSDFRPPATQATTSYSLRRVSAWLMMALIFGMFGMSAAVLVVVNPDVLLTGTVMLTYMTFVVATSVLTQHGATILSTTDYAILAPRPVSSRTFLAIRVTNVLFHTLLITTLMMYPPVIAFTVAHGVNAARGLAAMLAVYACALALTLGLIVAYSTILQTVGAARLQRALGYLQLALGLVAYGGFMLLMQTVERAVAARIAMPRGPWLLLLPSTWFAAYIEIASGVATTQSWIGAALSVLTLALLMAALAGRLGDDYTERLASVPLSGAPAVAAGGVPARAFLFRGDEAGAVAILVLAHFRHDTRVRLGILGVLPMILIYLFMGERNQGPDLMAMAVLLFPSILTQQLGSTDAYRASWIYFVTPSQTGRLIVALKNVILVYFLVPFTVLVAVLFTWRFGDVERALVHATMLGLVGHLALQATFIINARLPFALPPDKVSGGAGTITWMIVVLTAGNVVVFLLQRWVYFSKPRIAVAAGCLLVASWLVNRLLELRAARYSPQPTL